jgi:hypothetical protein
MTKLEATWNGAGALREEEQLENERALVCTRAPYVVDNDQL